jgi:hypothetical protein
MAEPPAAIIRVQASGFTADVGAIVYPVMTRHNH